MKIQWSPLAIDRISEIAEYIARDNPIAAQRWVNSVFNRVKQIKNFTKSGRRVAELDRSDIREIIHGNYRIIYRIENKRVSILTVRHFKQILPTDEVLKA